MVALAASSRHLPPSRSRSTRDTSEQMLIQRMLHGDETAWSAVHQAYAPHLKRLVTRITHDTHASDDIVQISFEKARAGLPSFDLEKPFRPWIFTIANNTALDWSRRRGKRRELPLVISHAGKNAQEFDIAQESLPDRKLIFTEPALESLKNSEESQLLKERVRLTIRSLSPSFQELLSLSARGVAYKDLSETLELPIGTVKSRLFAARAAFKKRWEEQFGAEPAF